MASTSSSLLFDNLSNSAAAFDGLNACLNPEATESSSLLKCSCCFAPSNAGGIDTVGPKSTGSSTLSSADPSEVFVFLLQQPQELKLKTLRLMRAEQMSRGVPKTGCSSS